MSSVVYLFTRSVCLFPVFLHLLSSLLILYIPLSLSLLNPSVSPCILTSSPLAHVHYYKVSIVTELSCGLGNPHAAHHAGPLDATGIYVLNTRVHPGICVLYTLLCVCVCVSVCTCVCVCMCVCALCLSMCLFV